MSRPRKRTCGAAAPRLAIVVARRMAARRLTLRSVAEASGLSVATVSALRSGRRGINPRPDTVRRLAAALGYTPRDLARRAGLTPPAPDPDEATLLALIRDLDPAARRLATDLLQLLAPNRTRTPAVVTATHPRHARAGRRPPEHVTEADLQGRANIGRRP